MRSRLRRTGPDPDAFDTCASSTPLCDQGTQLVDAARLGAAADKYAQASQRGEGDCAETGLSRSGPGTSTPTRIYAFIEEHLADPDLTPAATARAHHISMRSLYKLFENQETTVGAWIRQRRLACDTKSHELSECTFRRFG